MRKVILASAALLAISGCVTGNKMTQVSSGMTKDEVIKLLGNPDGFDSEGGYETLTYSNRLMSGWSWDRGDYVVVLQDGKVVRYGVDAVRQNPRTPL